MFDVIKYIFAVCVQNSLTAVSMFKITLCSFYLYIYIYTKVSMKDFFQCHKTCMKLQQHDIFNFELKKIKH